jgi:hypothetical protein
MINKCEPPFDPARIKPVVTPTSIEHIEFSPADSLHDYAYFSLPTNRSSVWTISSRLKLHNTAFACFGDALSFPEGGVGYAPKFFLRA